MVRPTCHPRKAPRLLRSGRGAMTSPIHLVTHSPTDPSIPPPLSLGQVFERDLAPLAADFAAVIAQDVARGQGLSRLNLDAAADRREQLASLDDSVGGRLGVLDGVDRVNRQLFLIQ